MARVRTSRFPSNLPGRNSFYRLYIGGPQAGRTDEALGGCGYWRRDSLSIPLHLQNAYGKLGYCEGDFPVAEKAAARIVSLPMFPGLTDAQQDHVVQQVMEFVSADAAAAPHSLVPAGGSSMAARRV